MHSSPWRLYKWRYDHLHVPVVVRVGEERRSTRQEPVCMATHSEKSPPCWTPAVITGRVTQTNITTLATDTGKLGTVQPTQITAAQAPWLLDYFVYNTKACQKLWTIFISFGKTATTDIKTTDTTTTTRHLIGVHRSMSMNVSRLTNKRLRMDL
jgi:hypothetical protein